MSRSSISWHIGRLVGSSLPALPITPHPKERLALVGSTVGMHCRSEPHQECVPGEIPTLWNTSPPRRQRLVQNSSSRSRSSGVNSIRARLSATDHAPRACRAMGWVGAHGRVPLVPRSADVDDDSMPTTGRTQGGRDRSMVCLVTETSAGRPRRLGFHRTLSARSWSGSGNATSPKEDDFVATASGPDLTAEGCGEPHPGRRTVPQAGQHGSDSKQGKN